MQARFLNAQWLVSMNFVSEHKAYPIEVGDSAREDTATPQPLSQERTEEAEALEEQETLAKLCPHCDSTLNWVERYRRWYCFSCLWMSEP